MKTGALVCVALLALVGSSCGGPGAPVVVGPCYTINGTAAGGLVECFYLAETNGATCDELKQMSGHCPSGEFVGCCVHSDGGAVCYSQDSTGTYQAGCSAPDRWQATPP